MTPGPMGVPPSANLVAKSTPRPKLSKAFSVPTRVTTKVMTLPVVALTLRDRRKQPIRVPPETGVGPSTVAAPKMPTHAGDVTATFWVCWIFSWTPSAPGGTPTVPTVMVSEEPMVARTTVVGLKLVDTAVNAILGVEIDIGVGVGVLIGVGVGVGRGVAVGRCVRVGAGAALAGVAWGPGPGRGVGGRVVGIRSAA